MTISRRRFLQIGVVSGLVVTLSASKAINAHALREIKPIDAAVSRAGHGFDVISQEAFSKQLNTRFQLLGIDTPDVTLTLTRLVDLKVENAHAATNAMTIEAFSLLFESSQATLLQQNQYEIVHAELGRFALFLVPMQSDQVRYEAVFNRLHA
ncbi:MAG: hypothetical protein V4805_08265 [Pseudomonadota bacterium]